LRGYALEVDWFEVWSRSYWLDYLGGLADGGGARAAPVRARAQRTFCFSELHAKRLREEGLRGTVTVLRGLYAGSTEAVAPRRSDPIVLFAAR